MSDQLLKAAAAASDVPERFDPATMRGEMIEAEHLARYRWAASLADGRRVLDAGCGTAYGTALLARSGASEVVGLDRAAEVLDAARPQMPGGVVLEEGDAANLSHPDGRFDLVVCFEVIEHLDDPGRALDEFARVLAPDGLLAVSSPNRGVYPPGNPHHVHEYTPAELEQELRARFASVSLERQHTWITSAVLEDSAFAEGGDQRLAGEPRVRKLAAETPGDELYTVALAGHGELPRPPATFELASRVELRKWDALWKDQARVLDEQAELLAEHEQVFANHTLERRQLWEELQELRRQLGGAEVELARVPALDQRLRELIELNDELLALNHDLQMRQVRFDELAAIAAQYDVLVQSKSWQLTRPLRRAFALARKFTT